MFSNFIYFIIVLLIYATYQPAAETNFTPIDTGLLFAALHVLFIAYNRSLFQSLQRRVTRESFTRLDNRFNNLLTRQSILSIALFAIDVYGLSLPSFFISWPLFSRMPTLLALVFLVLFVSYLSVVWAFAYDAHRRLYGSDISRSAYVWSQISFSVPVLLPWLVLSAITDLINALPFAWLKNQLATTTGSVVYFMFFLVIVAVIGPAMIQKFWRCRPLEDSTMRQRIEALCKKANLEYANILYWPIFGGRMITAGVMGLIKKFRYILVTSALLNSLQPAEIDARDGRGELEPVRGLGGTVESNTAFGREVGAEHGRGDPVQGDRLGPASSPRQALGLHPYPLLVAIGEDDVRVVVAVCKALGRPELAVGLGHAAEMLDMWDRFWACEPVNALSPMKLAQSAMWLREYERALQYLDEGEARMGSNAWYSATRLWTYLAMGRADDALALAPEVEADRDFAGMTGRPLPLALAGDTDGARAAMNDWIERYGRSHWIEIIIHAAIGDRQGANQLAAELDARPGGPFLLLLTSVYCACGAPFDLEATPNFRERITESGTEWPLETLVRYPAKDW